MDNLDNFRKNMKERREFLNITLKQIAEEIGVKEATVQRYESGNGIKSIPYEKIIAISKVLKCSPTYLIGWEDRGVEETFSPESAVLSAKVAKSPELKEIVSIYLALNEIGQKKLIDNARDLSLIYSNR